MRQPIAPIPVRPWTLNGISERMLVSHYENDYGKAVRKLNEIRAHLAASREDSNHLWLAALKREELATSNSVLLHELYFGNLGGEGNKVPDPIRSVLDENFGGFAAWRRDFAALALSLSSGSGWVVLTYSRRDGRLSNQSATDHAQAAVDASPILVLDMYEHAYHIDFGANATAYVDAFMRNINWQVVIERFDAARGALPPPSQDLSDPTLPSITVEELAAQLANRESLQVIDTRPRHYVSRETGAMEGAVWRDPDQIDTWIDELAPDQPVAVYCAYGFHVGCNVTRALRERGIDARYVRGGVSAWYASGGARSDRK